jgi:hypothetical protein
MNAIELANPKQDWRNGGRLDELVLIATSLQEVIERLQGLAESSDGELQHRFRIMTGEAFSLLDEMQGLIRVLRSKQISYVTALDRSNNHATDSKREVERDKSFCCS